MEPRNVNRRPRTKPKLSPAALVGEQIAEVRHLLAMGKQNYEIRQVLSIKYGMSDRTVERGIRDARAEQVIAWYAMRWSIEVMNHDSKQHLGFEQPKGWTRRSIERTAPLSMLLYSLIVLWFAKKVIAPGVPSIVRGTPRRPNRLSLTCSPFCADSVSGNRF